MSRTGITITVRGVQVGIVGNESFLIEMAAPGDVSRDGIPLDTEGLAIAEKAGARYVAVFINPPGDWYVTTLKLAIRTGTRIGRLGQRTRVERRFWGKSKSAAETLEAQNAQTEFPTQVVTTPYSD